MNAKKNQEECAEIQELVDNIIFGINSYMGEVGAKDGYKIVKHDKHNFSIIMPDRRKFKMRIERE